MAELLRCPQGHVWEQPAVAGVGDGLLCPKCSLKLAAVAPAEAAAILAAAAAEPPGASAASESLASLVPRLALDRDDDEGVSRRGRFRILRPYAQGGLGQISLALDVELEREVAIKEARPELADHPAARARLVSEARIAGQLEHPNIVPVYALGYESNGRPYYAMKLVKGRTLQQAIREHHREPSAAGLRALLRTLVGVCQAVAYAHSKGIVHRDLKPANIMVGDFGETLILDWGVAKHMADGSAPADDPSADSGAGATQSGQVLGTPSYMPPEQSEGSANVGPSADVYSLGSILYEILCGRAPHPGTSRSEVLLRMQQEEPPLPSRFAQVAPALEAVCLRCMARKPEDRYVTAADVTQDIERWLADEPVSAFREPLMTRLARWGRKHKAAMTATWVLLAAAVVGLSLGSYLINRQKTLAVQAKVEADENRRTADRLLTRNLITQVGLRLSDGRWTQAKTALREAKEWHARTGGAGTGLQLMEWCLSQASPPPLWTFTGHTGPVLGVAISHDGLWGASASADGTVRLWDLILGRAGRILKGHDRAVVGVAFMPGDSQVLSAGADGTLRLWDIASGQTTRVYSGHEGPIQAFAMSEASGRAATGSVDGTVRIWDVKTGRMSAVLRPEGAPVRAVWIHPDGSRLLVGVGDALEVWDADSQKRLDRVRSSRSSDVLAVREFVSFRTVVTSWAGDGLTFGKASAKGLGLVAETWETPLMFADALCIDTANELRALLIGTNTGSVDLLGWMVPTQPLLHTTDHVGPVRAVAMRPEAVRGLSGGDDGTVRLWNLRPEWQPGKPWIERQQSSYNIDFSPDGLTAVSASDQPAWGIILWDAVTSRQLRVIQTQQPMWRAVFLPDGRHALCGGANIGSASSLLQIWDLCAARPVRSLVGHTGDVQSVAVSRDGALALSGGSERVARIWDLPKGTELGVLKGHQASIHHLEFSADGKRALSVSLDGVAKLWDLSSRQELLSLDALGATFCPDGRQMLCTRSQSVELWDTRTRLPIRALEPLDRVGQPTISADGRWVAGPANEAVAIWDLASGELLVQAAHLQGRSRACVRFAPAGQFMAWSSDGRLGGTVRFADMGSITRLHAAETEVANARRILAGNPADVGALLALSDWYAYQQLWDWAGLLAERVRARGALAPALRIAHGRWDRGDIETARIEYERALRQREATERYLRHLRNATPPAAGSLTGSRFEIQTPHQCVLLGLRFCVQKFDAINETLTFLQPIYRSPDGQLQDGLSRGAVDGQMYTVLAKDGYAMAGIVVSSHTAFRLGIKLIFMRLRDGRLDPDDSYESEWFGSNDGPPWQKRMVSRGKPVLAIHGRSGRAIDALGLRLADDELPEEADEASR